MKQVKLVTPSGRTLIYFETHPDIPDTMDISEEVYDKVIMSATYCESVSMGCK